MILLVFEGASNEPAVMATLRYLYFNETASHILCSFGADTRTLWKRVKEHADNGYEVDVFTIVKSYFQERDNHVLDKYSSYQIDSVYLFFDYDPQNRTVTLDELNQTLIEMVDLFNNPMDRGMMYISFPMLESLFSIHCIPDPNYLTATVSIEDCHGYKGLCYERYELARNTRLLLLRTKRDGTIAGVVSPQMKNELLDRWNKIVIMNAVKANYICSGEASVPSNVYDISQDKVLNHELNDFVFSSSSISILSSFPLFLFEYFHGNGFF